MIELKGITKTFNPGTVNENTVLKDFNLTLNEGDFITVIGGNGAGKSTLLNIISGAIEADSGMILLNNVDVSSMREHQRAPYFGHVFQDPMRGTAPDMTVLENLALAYGRGRSRSLFRWSIRPQDKEYYVNELKSLGLGLENKMHQKVGLLSGGQRQALTLLMATMSQKPSHRKILKEYVMFSMSDKEAAKKEVNEVYIASKKEYQNKKKALLIDKSLPNDEKRRLIKEAYKEFDDKVRKYDLTNPVLLLDEHTAALDPKTAEKVLTITETMVKERNITTIMITHNMKDAIKYGNRLIMMSKGKIVVDVNGEEKKKLTIEDLLEKFTLASDEMLSDSTILGD